MHTDYRELPIFDTTWYEEQKLESLQYGTLLRQLKDYSSLAAIFKDPQVLRSELAELNVDEVGLFSLTISALSASESGYHESTLSEMSVDRIHEIAQGIFMEMNTLIDANSEEYDSAYSQSLSHLTSALDGIRESFTNFTNSLSSWHFHSDSDLDSPPTLPV